MLEKMNRYFSETLWNFDIEEKKGLKKLWFKFLRIFSLAFSGFLDNRCTFSASSLTYFTLMSIVPILALIISFARAFGYHDVFRVQLLVRFPDQTQAFNEIFKYADAFIQQAQGGLIAGIGAGVLFFSALFLLYDLEAIFNQIWGEEKHRSIRKMGTDYFFILLVAPVFFIFASSTTVLVVEFLKKIVGLLSINGWAASWFLFLVNLIPYVLFWMLFTFLYQFMPNTRVRFVSAAFGALITACLYLVTQWGYIYFQAGAGRYGAIYGTMAALPLFLVWLQISWFLVLFGAEISWAHQTFYEHEFESEARHLSTKSKYALLLFIAKIAAKKGRVSEDELKKNHQIPISLAKISLQELEKCHILHSGSDGYIPASELGHWKISKVLGTLASHGVSHLFDHQTNIFQKKLEALQKIIENDPENSSLLDVPDKI